MFFSYTDEPDNFIPLPVDRVKEIMEMNKNSLKPADLLLKVATKIVEKKPDYENVVGQDSLTRFDKSKKPKFKNNKKRSGGPNANKPNAGNPNRPNPNANGPKKPNNNNRPRPNNNRTNQTKPNTSGNNNTTPEAK